MMVQMVAKLGEVLMVLLGTRSSLAVLEIVLMQKSPDLLNSIVNSTPAPGVGIRLSTAEKYGVAAAVIMVVGAK